MKTTISKILDARETLSRLAEKALPVRQSYRLAKHENYNFKDT
nr:MAG TPA: hypothetical protein [Caudoviricetes sp.]